MFDKKLLLQHIENRARTLEEQNQSGPDDLQKPRSSEMRQFRGRDEEDFSTSFPRAGRGYVTKHPKNKKHIYTQFINPIIDGVESESVRDPNGPNGFMHVRLPRGYKMRDEVHPDHKPDDINEQQESPNLDAAVSTAVQGIKKIDKSSYPDTPKGERLYNAEVKMHIDKAKRDFHPKHHDEIHQLIMKAI